jgi:hypothetical protein
MTQAWRQPVLLEIEPSRSPLIPFDSSKSSEPCQNYNLLPPNKKVRLKRALRAAREEQYIITGKAHSCRGAPRRPPPVQFKTVGARASRCELIGQEPLPVISHLRRRKNLHATELESSPAVLAKSILKLQTIYFI